MVEYIKREDAINLLWLYADESCASVVSDFESLPAADVVEVRHGRWINLSRTSKCSECGFETGKYEPARRFCPMCGCRMIKGDKYDTISNQ